MAGSPPQQTERQSLCDALIRVGPDAPTLCKGWTTKDLAVHLVIRERHLLAAPGILLGGPFAGLLRETTSRVGRRPFDTLVTTIRQGPPLWMRPLDRVVNLLEYFVHHEDVRRAGGDTTPRPAAETHQLDEGLWHLLHRTARLAVRSLGPIGLTLQQPDGSTITARPGTPAATIAGAPGEITLYIMGRKDAAHVDLTGPPEAVDAVRTASFGF
jgi:uncharacterized protein (TIGR03085 family)